MDDYDLDKDLDDLDDLDDPENEFLPPGMDESDGTVTAIPTIRDYQKHYALSLDNNDQKAVRLYKQYESMERVRRFQNELSWVGNGQVYAAALK